MALASDFLSGCFPLALTATVLKPVLKKNNLNNSVMNNYGPIWNIQVKWFSTVSSSWIYYLRFTTASLFSSQFTRAALTLHLLKSSTTSTYAQTAAVTLLYVSNALDTVSRNYWTDCKSLWDFVGSWFELFNRSFSQSSSFRTLLLVSLPRRRMYILSVPSSDVYSGFLSVKNVFL